MSLGMTVTYVNSMSFYTPGFEVALTGVTVTGAFTVDVQRHSFYDNTYTDVRGLANILVVSSSVSATDFEYEYYNDVDGWEYVATVYDNTGATLASVTAGPFDGNQSRDDIQAEFPLTSVVISSVQQPHLNLPVIFGEFDSWTIPTNVLAQFNVLGRSKPVVLTDAFGALTGDFTIISDSGLTSILDQELKNILTYNDVLMFQPFYRTSGVDNMYFKVTALTVQRISYPHSIGEADRVDSTVLQYGVTFQEVDRPIASGVATDIIQWQDVKNSNTTWTDVKTKHPTWLDVLNNPTA
jgi:hypothetical protein